MSVEIAKKYNDWAGVLNAKVPYISNSVSNVLVKACDNLPMQMVCNSRKRNLLFGRVKKLEDLVKIYIHYEKYDSCHKIGSSILTIIFISISIAILASIIIEFRAWRFEFLNSEMEFDAYIVAFVIAMLKSVPMIFAILISVAGMGWMVQAFSDHGVKAINKTLDKLDEDKRKLVAFFNSEEAKQVEIRIQNEISQTNNSEIKSSLRSALDIWGQWIGFVEGLSP